MPDWGFPYQLQNKQIISYDWMEDFSQSIEYLKIDRPSNMRTVVNANETYNGATPKLINANWADFVVPKSPTAGYIFGASIPISFSAAGAKYQLGFGINGVFSGTQQLVSHGTQTETIEMVWYITGREFNIAFEISVMWMSYSGGFTLTANSVTNGFLWWMEM